MSNPFKGPKMIIIDSKEATIKDVIAGFKEAGVKYKIEPMKVGDFKSTKGNFIVERKSGNDWWASMVDHRLDSQAAEMYEQYKDNRYVFVETGSLEYLAMTKKRSQNWVYSKFGQLENLGVQVREYIDSKDLALKLDALDKYLGSEKVKRERRLKISSKNEELRFIASLPGIGEKRAKLILDELKCAFEVIMDIVERHGKRCQSIKGIGPKTMENCRKLLLKRFK